MKISGAHTVALPPDRAYEVLQDPAILAQCMPGCEALDRVAEDEYAMRMKMVLAAVSGQFQGKIRIADRNPPVGFRLIVEGQGKVGFMKGEGVLAVSESGGGSNVAFEGDVQVGGTLASVGQRLIDATAKLMIKRFFDKLATVAGAQS